MFSDFDFNILNNPEFKEDSVREELVLPLIKLLGYKPSGSAQVIRSRTLKHPFVSIGSTRNKISIIPDYVFEIEGKVHWVLDAKSPSENILKSKHVEQAYSYSIHPEIRSNFYALCNGKEFSLYDVRKFEPILYFKMEEINSNLEYLTRLLDPKIMANPEVVNYQPDFGLALTKMGVKPGFKFLALQVHTNFFAKIQDGIYTTTTTIPDDKVGFMGSFDFDEVRYEQLLKIIGGDKAELIQQALSRQPYSLKLKTEEFHFGLAANLQNEVINNAEESYVPFTVSEFIPYSGKP